MKDCCALIWTETRLKPMIPDAAIELAATQLSAPTEQGTPVRREAALSVFPFTMTAALMPH